MIWGQRIQDTVGEFGIAIRSGLENPDYQSAGAKPRLSVSGNFIITDRRDFPVPLDEFANSIFYSQESVFPLVNR